MELRGVQFNEKLIQTTLILVPTLKSRKQLLYFYTFTRYLRIRLIMFVCIGVSTNPFQFYKTILKLFIVSVS